MVKLERDANAKSFSNDNRGAGEDTADRSAPKNEEGSEAVEEDTDGLGETDARAPVSGTESESVEDAGIGGRCKHSPSSAATYRNGENMGEETDTSRVERNKRQRRTTRAGMTRPHRY
jgi:hypothetical protein